MPLKRRIPFGHGHFFISFSCYKRLKLFGITDGYSLVYDWFDELKKQGHFVTGFVIMPNHMHVTIAFRKTTKSIQSIVRKGKKMIESAIVNRLQKMGFTDLLQQLADAVSEADRKKGKLYQIWETGFDWRECTTEAFTWQRLEYMHDNPCMAKWRLTDKPAAWWHSSASFYMSGIPAAYQVLHFKELDCINLTATC